MARRQLVRTSLHRQVADQLRLDLARRFSPGDRLPSEASLATQFSVSLVTIREALSALAQEGLVERRHGSGTYVAERSAKRHIAIVSEMDLGSSRVPYFQLQVVQRLMNGLQGTGWTAQLYLGRTAPGTPASPTATTATGLIEALAGDRVGGIFAIATAPTSDFMERAAAARIPVVGDTEAFSNSIGTDFEGMLRHGIRRLAASGRKRIAVQLWDDPTAPHHTAVEALRTEIAACGAETRPGWIVSDLHPQIPGSGHQGFARIWHADAVKPDGLLVCDDHYFPEAAMGIVGRGIAVPEALSVISFANKGAGLFSPFPLSTLEVDPEAYADAAMALMQQLLRGETPAQRRVVVPFAQRAPGDRQASPDPAVA